MKSIVYLLLVCVALAGDGPAPDWPDEIIAKRALQDPFRVGIQHSEGTKIRRTDLAILYGFSSDPAEATIRLPGNQMFFCKIALFDVNSNSVPKTDLGATYGKRFSEVLERYPDKRTPTFEEMKLHFVTLGHKFSWFTLAAPDELFRIERSGIYTLHLEFQMLWQTRDSKSNYIKRVRFPAIVYQVFKE